MSATQINDVTVLAPRAEGLVGCNIERPLINNQHDTFCIQVLGWVLGRSSPITTVEVIADGRIVQTASVNCPRPDVGKAFPASPGAGNSGFRFLLNVIGVSAVFRLELMAVAEDGSRFPIGVIEGERWRLSRDDSSALQPILLTTLGRAGSTWVTHVLGQHPEIATYRPFEFEPRVGSYWVEVFHALSEPRSYLQPFAGKEMRGQWWLGLDSPQDVRSIPDPAVANCLGGIGLRALAEFCQAQLDRLYREVAGLANKPAARYFIEKYQNNPLFRCTLRDWYSGAKEIILVRDPRDKFCSVASFNAKRGYVTFDRQDANSDPEYMTLLMGEVEELLNIWRSRPNEVHLLRYEDVIREPHRTLKAVLQYLGLDSRSEAVTEILRRAEIETPAMRQHRTSVSPTDSIGRWRRDLSAQLQEMCETQFRENLQQLGYE